MLGSLILHQRFRIALAFLAVAAGTAYVKIAYAERPKAEPLVGRASGRNPLPYPLVDSGVDVRATFRRTGALPYGGRLTHSRYQA